MEVDNTETEDAINHPTPKGGGLREGLTSPG